jgi:2-hydroxy-6-oxonona-2,4-dienedioate hydrolase
MRLRARSKIVVRIFAGIAMPRAAIVTIAAVSIFAVAAAAAVWLLYRADLGRARAAIGAGARIAETAAGPIEYADAGASIPVLSIHGAGGGYDQGLANAADLVGSGFRIVAPSRFGYLGTPIPTAPTEAAQANAHAALLAALKIDKAVVVGVSAGARSAAEFAFRHPDRVVALVLIVPGTYAPTSPLRIEGSRGSAIAFWLVNAGADFAWWAAEKIAPSMLIRFMGVPPEVFDAAPQAERDRVTAIVRSVQPLSRRFAGINIDSNPDPGRPAMETIAAPALVVTARDDLFNTLPAAEFAAGTIPNARLIVHDTGGHLLVGRGREVREAVGEFIARHAGPTTPKN